MGPKIAFLLFLCAQVLVAQEDHEQVLNLLKSNLHKVSKNMEDELTAGRWEALAYWDQDTVANPGGLQEAVPDWYQFHEDNTFDLLLVDPSNAGRARQVVSGRYLVNKYDLKIIPPNKSEVVDQWTIYYLDSNYLVLEIDGLRVLFIHPPND